MQSQKVVKWGTEEATEMEAAQELTEQLRTCWKVGPRWRPSGRKERYSLTLMVLIRLEQIKKQIGTG